MNFHLGSMNDIITFFNNHPMFFIWVAVVFNAAVGAMELPTSTSSGTYRYFFNFFNNLAMNMPHSRGVVTTRTTTPDPFAKVEEKK